MGAAEFVHLHVHSEYSLLDGANRIRDLVQACVDDGQRALALTDHGNLFGSIELYKSCKAAGIKPIIGCEIYVAKKSRLEPHNRSDNGYHHLTLLARNEQGYKNLLTIASEAYLKGLSTRPRIDKAFLAEHAAGLSCLSGCLAGEINQLFLRGDERRAEELAVQFSELFGKQHFWLELQRNGIDLQTRANEAMDRLHQRTQIPLVATNDIHYLRHEDCKAQDVLLCINTGAKRADEKRFKFETESLYFRRAAEMHDMFRDLPASLQATLDVAEQVNLELEFGKIHVPRFAPEDGGDPEQLFDALCAEGIRRLYGAEHEQARARLAHEQRVIREMGFVSYFLIVWDLIRWARENKIPVGPGRGSAAGSIVAYALGITQVDPLRYGLLFERFLNSARISMPDIDIDFCKEGRERVLEYTRRRYGGENVAQIATFGTMASRMVLRDVGRVLDIPLKDVDRIAKKVPSGPQAGDLAQALEQDADLRGVRDAKPEYQELFDLSMKLEGLARNVSTHAAGVVIADRPIVEYAPLCLAGEHVATQWPAQQLEDLGLLKMDYLGLRTLTILARTQDYLDRQGKKRPSLESLPLDDAATYALLSSGDTLAVFQLESEGMRKLLMRLMPNRFEDLIAVLALYRPGPLESGMIDMFLRRKHGQERASYPHPRLEPILEETYGCIVYQEQVMQISSELAGFSLNEADNLRKAMGKKKPEIMEQFSAQFVSGAKQRGCAERAAREIWDNIVKFGGYGFNKSHSTAYALITYQTAYFKANHRREFLAANLSCEMESSDKIRTLLDDARRAGIAIQPPDIQHSEWEFAPEGSGIRYGLGAIKGTGARAIEALCEARQKLLSQGGKLGLHELCQACDPALMPRLCWEALIKSGCFDASGYDRGAVMHALDRAMAESVRVANDRKSGQSSMFDLPATRSAARDGDGIDASVRWSKADMLKAEKETLGFYMSGHPLEDRAALLRLLSSATIAELGERGSGSDVVAAGMITDLEERQVKSGPFAGRKMARFRIEDLSGSIATVCFPRTFEACRRAIVEDAVVVVRARLEENSDGPGLVAEDILSFPDALLRFEGSLMLEIEPKDEPLLPHLRALLQRHPGRRPVWLSIRGDDGIARRLRLGAGQTVAISLELTAEIDRLLGKGRAGLARA